MSKQSQPILVTGASGMLGRDLVIALRQSGEKVIASDRETTSEDKLDITNLKQLTEFIQGVSPKVIINCAAFTDVDGAESQKEKAFLINSQGVANIASVAKEVGSRVVQISTDYVFGIQTPRPEPISENEVCNPQSVYGSSKFQGEQLLNEILPDSSLIVRTSWLHGLFGPNFIDTMLKLGKERESISVVDDQIGSPTWSVWLAEILVALVKSDATGVYHASSKGGISWYDLACEIFRQAGMKVNVMRQSTAQLNRPAKRPAFSTLDLSKLESKLGIIAPDWKEFVKVHLEARGIIS